MLGVLGIGQGYVMPHPCEVVGCCYLIRIGCRSCSRRCCCHRPCLIPLCTRYGDGMGLDRCASLGYIDGSSLRSECSCHIGSIGNRHFVYLPCAGISGRKGRSANALHHEFGLERIACLHLLGCTEQIHDDFSIHHIPHRVVIAIAQGGKHGVDIALIVTAVHTLGIVHVVGGVATGRCICRID